MKETRNLLLGFQVKALTISRRNILEQLMRVPRRCWQLLIWDDPLQEGAGSRLSEMIHFGKAEVTCKVSDPSFANFDFGRSNFLVATNPLPILIKEDPASFANFHQRRSSFLMVKFAIKRRITVLWRRKTFHVQLRWFIILKVDRIICPPLEQWFGCMKDNLDVVVSMYLPFWINKNFVFTDLLCFPPLPFEFWRQLEWTGGGKRSS